jgi:hypothetical protein
MLCQTGCPCGHWNFVHCLWMFCSPLNESAQLFIYMGVSVCVCLHTHRHQGWTSTTFFRSSLSFRIIDQIFLCISSFPYVYVPHPSFIRLYHPNNMWKKSNYEPPDYAVFFTWVHMLPLASCSGTLWNSSSKFYTQKSTNVSSVLYTVYHLIY